MYILKRIFKYYLKYIPRTLLGILAIVLLTQCDILNTYIIKKLIDIFSTIGNQIINNDTLRYTIHLKYLNITHIFKGKSELFKLIIFINIVTFINIFIKGLFVYTKEYTLNSVNLKVMKQIRQDLYEKLIFLPLTFYDNNKTGDLMAKVTNDVNMIQGTLESFIKIITDFIQSIFFVGLLFYLNWQLSLVIIGMFPITGYILKKFSIPIREASRRIAENISEISAFLQETLSGIKVIKIFTREKSEINKFKHFTYETYARNIKAVRLIAFQKPINELLSIIGVITVILFSGYQMIEGKISLGDFGRFIVVATLAYKPLKGLGNVNAAIQKALASGKRIFDLMEQVSESTIEKKRKTFEIENIKGYVEFKNVYFSYDKKKSILKNINIKANPNDIIAIVGPSGGGKTTIVNLIPRFYEINKGKILIDNIDIKKISLASLRKHIGMVPQDTFLFSGTIKDNIAYAKENATFEEIVEAAKKANAHNFIIKLKNGYNTEIGERGIQLSGGEKQRISIARAILKNPKILILDEATSALDTESEILVQEALSYLMKGKTTFVIAHRLSTIRNATKIIVLENGQIVQIGTHKQLIRNKKGLYYKLCNAQKILS